jgi:hypothetical protein
MSDESNIPTNLEEQAWIPVEEAQPEEHQQELPVAEAHETEVLQQQQEIGKSGRKPSTSTRKSIRLATISKLLEKQATQMDKIEQMVQPLQKQLKSVERRLEFIKQMPSQLKQLQKEVSQVQKEGQQIRLLLSKKTASTKKRVTKSKNTKRKNTKSKT